MRAFILVSAAVFGLVLAQPYRCAWQVVAVGGGEVAGGNYRAGTTAGQTAVGRMTGNNLIALVGFWQTDLVTGLKEDAQPGAGGKVLSTRLYPVAPNPFTGRVRLVYTLAGEERVRVEVYDLTGRRVRTLADLLQRPGRYHLNWDARDERGRAVPAGVYILRFSAGGYRNSAKLILER